MLRSLLCLLLMPCSSFGQHIEAGVNVGRIYTATYTAYEHEKSPAAGIVGLHSRYDRKWWQAGIGIDARQTNGKAEGFFENVPVGSLQQNPLQTNGNLTVKYSEPSPYKKGYSLCPTVFGNGKIRMGRSNYIYAGATAGKTIVVHRITTENRYTSRRPEYRGPLYGIQAGYSCHVGKHVALNAEAATRKTEFEYDKLTTYVGTPAQTEVTYLVTIGARYIF